MVITEIELGKDGHEEYFLEVRDNGDFSIYQSFKNSIDEAIYLPRNIAYKLYNEFIMQFAGSDGQIKDI